MSLRDRFFTRRVGNAMTSPLTILLVGAGTAAGVLVGLPLWLAPVVGVGTWVARVAAALPKGLDADGIDPYELDEPWRSSVWHAKRSRRHYAEAVAGAKDGPLRDRLDELGSRIATMVAECWAAARGGNTLSAARARIDVAGITQRLAQIEAQRAAQGDPGGTLAATAESLASQLATAKRMDEVITDTAGQLQLLNARLDEAVTRAIELSVRAQSVEDLGGLTTDINDLVTEMESLRQTLTESDPATAPAVPPRARDASASPDTGTLSSPSASPPGATPLPTGKPAPQTWPPQPAPQSTPQPEPGPDGHREQPDRP